MRILLAEDNIINQRVALSVLEKRGHSAIVANNGQEALEILARHNYEGFDAVLMDVQMPKIDGFEATTIIRDLEKTTGSHLPIVAMTAHAMREDRDRCIKAGMNVYLTKPLNFAEVFAVIESVVPIRTKPQ